MQDNKAETMELELELPEGEVDIHEADVDDSIKDAPVLVQKEEEKESEKDELEDVSKSVQKRIDKLTYKMREAERQRDEAVNYAKGVNQTASELKEKLRNSDSSLFKEYDNRVQSQLDQAKILLREAQESGNGEAIVEATERLSRVSAEAENLRRLTAQQQIRERNAPKEVPVQEAANQFSSEPQSSPPDPKAEVWAKENSWFGTDQAMTFAAFGIHKELVEIGVDPASDNYYVEVNKRMRENFPHRFSQEESAPVQQVAASSRGARGKKGVRKIKLTPSQVAIAKRLNVPIEEYAKQHAKMQGV